jgi:hypothetical protein
MTRSGRRKQATDKSGGEGADPERAVLRRNRPDAINTTADPGGAAFQRAGFRDPGLVLRWREIVGAEIAQFTQPLKLSEDAGGGVLTLIAEPAAAVFLRHQSPVLCARINAYLGRPAIGRLRFVKGSVPAAPRPRPRIRAQIGPDDPAGAFRGPDGLRSALLDLARARRASCD